MRVPAFIRSNVRCAALAFGPVAAVLAARILLPVASPSKVNATPPAPASSIDVGRFTPPQMTVDQARLAEVIQSKRSLAFARSPVVARLAELPVDDTAPVFAPPVVPSQIPVAVAPDMHLTSIFVARDVPVAVLGGRMIRVGDSLGSGWTVTAIDSGAGSVVATHTSGATGEYLLRP